MPTSFDEIEAQIESFIALGLATSDQPFHIRVHSFGGDMYALKLEGENYEFISPMYEIDAYDFAKCLRRKIRQLRSKR